MSKSAEALASSSMIAGLVLGISLYTGVSIDPLDLLNLIGGAIAGTLSPQEQAIWGTISLVVIIVGIIQTIILVVSLVAHGLEGIVVSIMGFLGGLFLVFYPIPAVLLILVSLVIGAIL